MGMMNRGRGEHTPRTHTSGDQLLIFRARRRVIDEWERNGQIKDRALYLAWDTSELLAGNQNRELENYTGSNMSVRELRSLFKEMTEEWIRDNKDDLTVILNKLYGYEADLNEFKNALLQNIEDSIRDDEGGFDLSDKYISRLDIDDVKYEIQTNMNSVYIRIDSDVISRIQALENAPDINIELLNNDIEELQKKTSNITYIQVSEFPGELAVKPEGRYLVDNGEGLHLVDVVKTLIGGVRKNKYIWYDRNETKIKESGDWVNYIGNIKEEDIILRSDLEAEVISKDSMIPDINGKYINKHGRKSEVYGEGSIALGFNSDATHNNSIALGRNAEVNAEGSIQLGEGINDQRNTLKYKDTVIVKNGLIPDEILSHTFKHFTRVIDNNVLDINNEYTFKIDDNYPLTDNDIVWVSPGVGSQFKYGKYGFHVSYISTPTEIPSIIRIKVNKTLLEPVTVNVAVKLDITDEEVVI